VSDFVLDLMLFCSTLTDYQCVCWLHFLADSCQNCRDQSSILMINHFWFTCLLPFLAVLLATAGQVAAVVVLAPVCWIDYFLIVFLQLLKLEINLPFVLTVILTLQLKMA